MNLHSFKLNHEIQEHMKTKEELENNNANLKQLNRGNDPKTLVFFQHLSALFLQSLVLHVAVMDGKIKIVLQLKQGYNSICILWLYNSIYTLAYIVSLLALDDFSNLQQKYEMEIRYRAQAEKLAVEVH